MRTITQYTLFIILLSSNILCSEEKSVSTSTDKMNYISLFDGKTLKGWVPSHPKHQSFWSVKDGMILGDNFDGKKSHSTYLVHTTEYEDFELTFDFRLSGNPKSGVINSGMHYRTQFKKSQMIGYQADIGKGWWGGIYEEHGRGKLVNGNAKALLSSKGFKHDSWHAYKIMCKGNHHQLFINGFLTADYKESQKEVPSKGVFGIQLHGAGHAKIEVKNIKLRIL